MKKLKFSRRKLILVLLPVVILLIPLMVLASVYFSPGRVKNFPIGKNTAQINITPDGVNIFYPKDDTTFYYFHNFSWPSQITGTNTKLSDLSVSENAGSIWDFKSSQDQLVAWFQNLFKQSPISISISPKHQETDKSNAVPNGENTNKPEQPSPPKAQKFTSQLLDFTLNIPAGNYSEIEQKADYERLIMWITPENYNADGEERLIVLIYPVSKGCKDTSKIPANEPKKISVAGKYPIALIHGSISHGDSGHFYHGVSELENGYCLDISVKYDRKYEQRFIDILEGK